MAVKILLVAVGAVNKIKKMTILPCEAFCPVQTRSRSCEAQGYISTSVTCFYQDPDALSTRGSQRFELGTKSHAGHIYYLL